MKHSRYPDRLPLANEAESDVYTMLGNEVAMDENGWAVIPYGDWPHQFGLQRFDQPAAQMIFDRFKSLAGKLKRAITGLPIFNGHPDIADQYERDVLPKLTRETDRAEMQQQIRQLREDFPDHAEYGQLANMELRKTGLAVQLVLSQAGAALVSAGKKFISPNWGAVVVGKQGDKPIWSPARLTSIGLTSRPNIPVQSLVNSAAAAAANRHPTKKNMIPEWILKLLGLANEATEDQAKAAMTALLARPEPTALANEQTAHNEAKAKLTAAEGRVTALSNEVTTTKAKLTETETALANERELRVKDLVADAIRRGRVFEADRATWERRLKTDFAAESTALANAKVVVKTESEIPARLAEIEAQMKKDLNVTLANADKGKGGEGDPTKADTASEKIEDLVNKEMAKPSLCNIKSKGARYNQAFANVKKSHPHLFGMKND
jgi:Mu-like prophage I protein